MSVASVVTGPDAAEAVRQLGEAAAAKKCWHCGCLHSSLRAIGETFPPEKQPASLGEVMELARSRLTEVSWRAAAGRLCWVFI